MDNNNKKLLSRSTYKKIKNMDREQLSAYVTRLYVNGFEAGRKAAAPDIMMRTFREALLSIDSIGPTRADAIMKKFGEMFAMKEEAVQEPAEEEKEADADVAGSSTERV